MRAEPASGPKESLLASSCCCGRNFRPLLRPDWPGQRIQMLLARQVSQLFLQGSLELATSAANELKRLRVVVGPFEWPSCAVWLAMGQLEWPDPVKLIVRTHWEPKRKEPEVNPTEWMEPSTAGGAHANLMNGRRCWRTGSSVVAAAKTPANTTTRRRPRPRQACRNCLTLSRIGSQTFPPLFG